MIQDIIKKITKIKPKLSTTGGTSDARFIRKIAPCLEFGLVGKTMHKVDEAVSLLEKAKKPVLYAGGGIIQGNASEELKKLAKIMNAPVTNTLMGLGAFPATHENFIGMLGMHGTYEANMAMHEADLIFALGSRFDDRTTNNPQKYSLNAKKIHLDCDYGSIEKIINVDVSLNGDAKKILNQILQ